MTIPKFPDTNWLPIWGKETVSIIHPKNKAWKKWQKEFNKFKRNKK